MKKKLIAVLVSSVAAITACSCGFTGTSHSEAAHRNLAAESELSDEEALESSIQANLDAMDAIIEEEEESRRAAESEEAVQESIAMEEAKAETDDYTAANLDLEDIDPVEAGLSDIFGLDFSTFPETNGAFTYTWNYKSYDDTPEVSKVDGTEFESDVWYQVKMVPEGDVYSDFKNAVKEWLFSQSSMIARNDSTDSNWDGGIYSWYWTAPDRAILVKEDGGSFIFKVYCLKTYTIKATYQYADRESNWEENAPIKNFFFTLDENVENMSAGTLMQITYLPTKTEDALLRDGAYAMNGFDLDSLIDINFDELAEGDSITITVTALKGFDGSTGMTTLFKGQNFLQVTVVKN